MARRDSNAALASTKGTKAICGAVRGSGGLCQRAAGEGTDHYGVGRCSTHGGKSKAGIRAAGVTIGEGMILTGRTVMGIPVQITPVEALTRCVEIAAGEVAYCTLKVQELTEDQAMGPVMSRVEEYEEDGGGNGRRRRRGAVVKATYGPPALHVWIKERQRAVDRLARLAKMALDAGVAQQEIDLRTRMADVLVAFAQGLMNDLGVTRGSEKLQARAQEAIRRNLLKLTEEVVE